MLEVARAQLIAIQKRHRNVLDESPAERGARWGMDEWTISLGGNGALRGWSLRLSYEADLRG
jgi:hypothetical protein